MDWDKLRIFHAVAAAGSFTHAGEALNLSQSAVSRQIGTLEDSLGVSLFHRHARGLILTEEGELLYSAAQEIFGKLAMIEGQLADSRQLAEGPLRITMAQFIGSCWLAPRLHTFRKNHPGVHLTMLLDDRIFNLGMREADAAIRLYRPEQPDLVQRHLADITFGIYAADIYLEKNGVPETVADLKGHSLIAYPEDTPPPFPDPNWLLRASGEDTDNLSRSILMNSMHGIYEAARTGCGLAALPVFMAGQDSCLKRVLPELTRPPVEMYFVYPEERRHSGRLEIFRDFLLESVEATEF